MLETFQLIVCYSYGDYNNLANLCDESEVHTVVEALGSCFTPEVFFDQDKVDQLTAKTVEIILNSESEENEDIVNLNDLISLSFSDPTVCGQVGFKLSNETQSMILNITSEGIVQTKRVSDGAW